MQMVEQEVEEAKTSPEPPIDYLWKCACIAPWSPWKFAGACMLTTCLGRGTAALCGGFCSEEVPWKHEGRCCWAFTHLLGMLYERRWIYKKPLGAKLHPIERGRPPIKLPDGYVITDT